MNLLSGSQTNLKLALERADDINDHEAALIIEHLNSKIASSSEIPEDLFASMLKFGALKEGLNSTIAHCLEAMSASRIRPSHIPRVVEYGKEIKQVEKIDEILNAWEKGNPKLESIIDSERGDRHGYL